MAIDLSQVGPRIANQSRGRLTDRRSSILPGRRDTRAPDLRPSGDMRSASRGDVGGADALMRTLGLVREAAGDFQSYAGNKFAKDESANAARGLVDQAADNVDPELARKSAAYKDSVARGRTASAWADYALEMDEELNGIVENQQQLTLEERRDELSAFIDRKFAEFAISDETGQLQDFLATPGAMRYLGEKMTEARAVVAADATKHIEARFNVEAVGHFTKNIRDQAQSGKVDWPTALALVPATVPDSIKRAAIKDTVFEIVETLKEQGREVEGQRLLESLDDGGFELGVGGSTDQSAIDAMRGPVAVDIPASNVAPSGTPPAPAYSRTALKAKIAGPESGGDDNATNGMGSSASGRYQFVEGTFKQLYKRVYGASSSAARDAWEAKRFDPAVQERLMDALIADNETILTGARIPINDANMYVMHVLGSGDGPKFLKAAPSTPVASILSAAIVRQNPTYFGAGKTVGQAHARMASVVGASSADGDDFDPAGTDPTYQSPGRELSPLEEYLRGPKGNVANPVLTGGLMWTQQERNSIREMRKRYTETAIDEWHKKRGEEQTFTAQSMMMRVIGQGPPITSQDINSAAERRDVSERDAITLHGMLYDAAARKRAEADRAESHADRQRERDEADAVDGLSADIMAPVYTGKRTPEQARAVLTKRLADVSPAVARRALGEIAPALNAWESVGEQTPQARDALQHMDDQDRRAFMGAAMKGVRPSQAKRVSAEAGNLMDQAIQRTQRDITRGVAPADARERAYQWLQVQLGEMQQRNK